MQGAADQSDWRGQMINVAQSFWFWLGCIVVLRLIGLFLSDADLSADEAQYWVWSRELAFGYFSKPPMIAWLIALSTSIFGNEEWAVRLFAPLLHAGTATILYLTAKRLFDANVALWVGLSWLLLPGVGLSSFLFTTDAPLMFFFAGALYFFFKIIDAPSSSWIDYVLLGACIGFGLLSKYAMIYFLIGAASSVLLVPKARAVFADMRIIATIAIAALLFAPNLIWNVNHDFQTVTHTAANADWRSNLFQPLELVEFLAGQFVVAGFGLFAVLLAGIVVMMRSNLIRTDWRYGALFCFTAAPLIIISMQALLSRAHANWAASAYVGGVILIPALAVHMKWRRFFIAALAINAATVTLLFIGMTNFQLIDSLGAGRAIDEIRGWRAFAEDIERQYDGQGVILFDDRSSIGAMLYYAGDVDAEIAALDPNSGVHHHYEAFMPFDPARHKRALFVSILDSDAHINYRFRDITPVGVARAELSPGEYREFHLFDISGYYGKSAVRHAN